MRINDKIQTLSVLVKAPIKMNSYNQLKTGISKNSKKVFRRSIKKANYSYFFINTDLKKVNQSYCILSWFKSKQCSTFLSLIKYANGSYCFIKLIHGLNVGDIISKTSKFNLSKSLTTLGAKFFCHNLPQFSICSNLPNFNTTKPIYARSAGTYAQLFSSNTEKNLYLFKLNTGKILKLNSHSLVTIGRNSNVEWGRLKYLHAGEKIVTGRRQVVRGVARNPVDHPNGGRTKTNSPEKSLWGWIAKKTK